MSKSSITLKQLLENDPWEVKIESLKVVVKVKDPTVQDKIDVRTEAMKNPLWDKMSDIEKATEISSRLALRMLVDPKIEYEEYLKCASPKIDAIIEAINWEWNKRVRKLTSKTRKAIKDFLDQEMEKSLKSSTNS